MKDESNDLAVPDGGPNREVTANPLFRKILRVSHLLAIFCGLDMDI